MCADDLIRAAGTAHVAIAAAVRSIWPFEAPISRQWMSFPTSVKRVKHSGLAAESQPCTRIANLAENQLPPTKNRPQFLQEPIVLASSPED